MADATIQNGEQRAVFQIPTSGKSKHGKTVALENVRMEAATPEDAASVVIEAHEDGAPGHVSVKAADGLADPPVGETIGVALKARADGQPGAGEVTIEQDVMLSIVGPNAATFDGAITGASEDIP